MLIAGEQIAVVHVLLARIAVKAGSTAAHYAAAAAVGLHARAAIRTTRVFLA